MSNGVLSRRYSGQGVKLTTDLYLVPRLRMNGVIPLLPLYAFVAWTGKTLLFKYIYKYIYVCVHVLSIKLFYNKELEKTEVQNF
jgi:hypothetical protein